MTHERSNEQIIETEMLAFFDSGWEASLAARKLAAALAAAGRLVTPEHDAQVLRTYADELEKSTSAEAWDKADFVSDVRDWADGVSDGTVS